MIRNTTLLGDVDSAHRKKAENAWVAKVPTWPLIGVFLGQIAAVAGGVYWVVSNGELCATR